MLLEERFNLVSVLIDAKQKCDLDQLFIVDGGVHHCFLGFPRDIEHLLRRYCSVRGLVQRVPNRVDYTFITDVFDQNRT